MGNNETVQKSNKGLYIIITVLIAVLVGVGGYFILFDGKDGDDTKDSKQEEKKTSPYDNYKETDFVRETTIVTEYNPLAWEDVPGDLIAEIKGNDIVIKFSLSFYNYEWIVKNANAKYLYYENDGCQVDRLAWFFIGTDGYLYVFDQYIDDTMEGYDGKDWQELDDQLLYSDANFKFRKINTESKVLEFIANESLDNCKGELVEILLDNGKTVQIGTYDTGLNKKI